MRGRPRRRRKGSRPQPPSLPICAAPPAASRSPPDGCLGHRRRCCRRCRTLARPMAWPSAAQRSGPGGAGRCLLPLDALAAEGLAPEAVMAAPTAAAVRRVVASLARPALDTLPGLRQRLRGLPRGALAAALPLVLARRDLRRLAAGRTVPAERGFGDRAAVALAGLLGRV
ncbi:squalene/phytoene synthase family protein [Siccirubricoccus deserti]